MTGSHSARSIVGSERVGACTRPHDLNHDPFRSGTIKGGHLAKPNYQFEKRQRDLAKKRKQEEKRLQKLAEKATAEGGSAAATEAPSDDSSAAEARPDDESTPGA